MFLRAGQTQQDSAEGCLALHRLAGRSATVHYQNKRVGGQIKREHAGIWRAPRAVASHFSSSSSRGTRSDGGRWAQQWHQWSHAWVKIRGGANEVWGDAGLNLDVFLGRCRRLSNHNVHKWRSQQNLTSRTFPHRLWLTLVEYSIEAAVRLDYRYTK